MSENPADLSNENSISLNNYISSTGICSRREADKMIAEGRITINGAATKLGNRVFEGDVVKIDGKALPAKPQLFYIAFNKPKGIICSTDPKVKKNIASYINHPERLFPIGRLDVASEGLLLLTNDGDIVNKILRAGNQHEKEYVVHLNRSIAADFVDRMSNGISILGTITKKCKVTQIDPFSFKIVLTQGLNRQIRRMCENLGYEVVKLKRIRIMNIHLSKLTTGQWRNLSTAEIKQIRTKLKDSSKTEEASIDRNKKKSFIRKIDK